MPIGRLPSHWASRGTMDKSRNAVRFTRISALFDRDGTLISWDNGLGLEFATEPDVIGAGARDTDLVYAVRGHASGFRTAEGKAIDPVQIRLNGSPHGSFGTPRSLAYRTPDDRVIRVEETISVNGDIFRIAEDATDAWNASRDL